MSEEEIRADEREKIAGRCDGLGAELSNKGLEAADAGDSAPADLTRGQVTALQHFGGHRALEFLARELRQKE